MFINDTNESEVSKIMEDNKEIKEGIEQVAKKMLELNIPIQDIIKTTGLQEKQILELKKDV